MILDALKHDCADIRVAACSCLKNISRSSKVRCTLLLYISTFCVHPNDSVDVVNLQVLSAGRLSCDTVIAPLVQLLCDSSTSVQVK